MDRRDHWCAAVKSGKECMYRGIGRHLRFRDAHMNLQFDIISVKGGENITSDMVHDLTGTMECEKVALRLFLSLKEPSREITKEASLGGVL